MKWFLLSIMGMFFTSSAIVSLKFVSMAGVRTEFMMASYFIIISVILFAALKIRKIKIISDRRLITLAIASGALGAVSNFLLFESIRISPNPGYSMALFNTEAIIIAVVSIFLFKSELSKKSIFGILLVVIGASILVI